MKLNVIARIATRSLDNQLLALLEYPALGELFSSKRLRLKEYEQVKKEIESFNLAEAIKSYEETTVLFDVEKADLLKKSQARIEKAKKLIDQLLAKA
jgi:hypothetical protein